MCIRDRYKDYPTLMRPVTVRNSRYNQHMTTGSLLVEVGTAGNSLEEAIDVYKRQVSASAVLCLSMLLS